MTRTLLLAAFVAALVPAIGAVAQEPARDRPSSGGAGLRTGNITSTGATVPTPGAPQASGTTPLDRGVEQQDDKITNGICKGC